MKRRTALLLLEGLLFASSLLAAHAAIITFDANGGQRTMDPLVFSPGTDQSLPRCAFTKAGAFFLGWALSADGYATLLDGDSTDDISVDENGEITLYAVWRSWSLPLYAVLDLSAGSSASAYPVSYFAEPPSGGFNVDAYKTTKLVLRFINPGSFLMRGQYETTLTHPFYIGVFEMTQKQYQLIMGNNPSNNTGDKRPVDSVTYNAIRGSSSGAQWPSSGAVDSTSLLGKLRARTGLHVDLPTEAQWEYACRAGTTSSYNNGGNTEADLKKLGRYGGNKSDGKGGYTGCHTTVGSYLPNAWGLYDMHGNVYEWCLDWCGNVSSPLMDPKGASSGSARILRGGCFGHGADACASSYPWRTDCNSPSYSNNGNGVRLAMTPSVNTDTYAVRFDANGGEGAMMKKVFLSGENAELPAATFSREGHTFVGWATSADGPVAYGDGETIAGGFNVANGETITLYARWSEGSYTVHFDANGGSGTMPDQMLWFGIPGTLSPCAFSSTNGYFVGWATSPDGNATYLNGDSNTDIKIQPSEMITLYAVWTAFPVNSSVARYSFTGNYNDESENGYTLVNHGSTWTADRFGTENRAIALDGQQHYLANDDFVLNHTFTVSCWIKTSVTKDHDSTGHKEWAYGNYPVYPRSGGSSSSLAGIGFKAGTDGISVVEHASNYQPEMLTWSGSISSEWNHLCIAVENDTTATIYLNGELKTSGALSSRSKTLGLGNIGGGGPWGNYTGSIDDLYVFDRAITSNEVKSAMNMGSAYAVRFNANGGEGTMPKRVFASGDDAALPAATFTRNGYTFVGWATSGDGPVAYGDGEIVADGFDAANGETITLYALWSQGTYSVQFNANGGFGSMPNQTLWLDVAQPLATNAFVRDGFAFVGWAMSPDGRPVCSDGSDFLHTGEMGDTVTLYAAWALVPGLAVRYYDISTSGYSTWIQSESAMTDYFAAQTPTLETNTLAFGDSLVVGYTDSLDSSARNKISSFGMDSWEENQCRFHGQYAASSANNFAVYLTGMLDIPEQGTYSLAAMADDFIAIYIDGQKVIAGEWANIASGSISLDKGQHSIAMAFYEGSGSQGFTIQWKKPSNSSYTLIPQSSLWHAPGGDESADTAVLWGAVDVTSEYGSPEPDGRFDAPWGATVSLSMSDSLVVDPDDPGVRLSCAGWTGTGSVPATGTETNVSLVLRECSTLTWLWETNSVRVSLAVEGDAEANGETEGWFALGDDAALSFAPTSAVAVVCDLSGDTEGVVADAAARMVTIPANRPRAVTVNVRAMTPADSLETGEAGAWSGVGGGIEAAGGWHLAPDTTAADGYSLRSDETVAGGTATVELAVPLAGTLMFDWRVLTTARRHYARFYVDGVRQKQITGETDWTTETVALDDGAHILRWTYEKSTAAASSEDAAFLDNVHWVPLTLEAALDATNIVWSTEGGAEWIPQVSVSSDGASAARSGALVGENTSRLVATVQGGGTFAWSWKADIEGIAGVDVWLDGKWQENIWLDSEVTDWEEMSLDIDNTGTHEVVFGFWNGGGQADIGDCAFIDRVTWTMTDLVVEDVTMPLSYFKKSHPTLLAAANGNAEAAARAIAANGINSVWQCYVAGLNPEIATDQLLARITMRPDGTSDVSWSPELPPEEAAKRTYRVLGKRRLDDSNEDWTDMTDVQDVDAAGYRFFKVSVEMK